MNLTSIHEVACSIPGLAQWVGDLTAVAPIQPLAWELPYALGAALKSKRIVRKIKCYIKKLQTLPISFLLHRNIGPDVRLRNFPTAEILNENIRDKLEFHLNWINNTFSNLSAMHEGAARDLIEGVKMCIVDLRNFSPKQAPSARNCAFEIHIQKWSWCSLMRIGKKIEATY